MNPALLLRHVLLLLLEKYYNTTTNTAYRQISEKDPNLCGV